MSEQLHDLLPWYMTGTLDPEQAVAFRDHLPDCEACRAEMDFIARLQAEIDRHGEAFLEEHPPAQRLVAAFRGELGQAEAAEVRRHLALCAACATESRWIADDERSESTGEDARRRLPAGPWPWVALAAAALALALVVPFWRSTPDPTGIVQPRFVRSTERADGQRNVFEVERDGAPLWLMFSVDVPPAAFPVTIEIDPAADGAAAAFRRSGIEQSMLLNDLYLFVRCSRQTCPAGRYVARISGSDGSAALLRFEFEVVE